MRWGRPTKRSCAGLTTAATVWWAPVASCIAPGAPTTTPRASPRFSCPLTDPDPLRSMPGGTGARHLDAYLLCATPRTGCTLLCDLLRSTHIAGRPESYFRQQDEQAWADRWRLARNGAGTFDYGDYVRAAVAAGSSPNGLFGARVMRGTPEEIVTKLGSVHPDLPCAIWRCSTAPSAARASSTCGETTPWPRRFPGPAPSRRSSGTRATPLGQGTSLASILSRSTPSFRPSRSTTRRGGSGSARSMSSRTTGATKLWPAIRPA